MNKLKILRNERVVSQKEVASAIGITTSYYGMLELGVRVPSLITATKLADYFKMPIEQIFLQEQTTNSCLE